MVLLPDGNFSDFEEDPDEEKELDPNYVPDVYVTHAHLK